MFRVLSVKERDNTFETPILAKDATRKVMATLDPETIATIETLKRQALTIVDGATAVELRIFDLFGESDRTLSYLEEMTNVSEEAASAYSRLSTLQLQVARSQPVATADVLQFLNETVELTQLRLPALARSIEEVKLEWDV